MARRRRWLRVAAWVTALLLAVTASVVALSTRAQTFERRPYTPSDELEEALKQWPRIERGESLYQAQCATCHGAESWGSPDDGRTPALAGQHYQYLVKQLADLRRADPALDRGPFHVATLQVLTNVQAIADVAAYLSGLTPNPRPRVGRGDNTRRGGAAYDRLCSACHYENGEGDAIFFTPRISAQHYEYLLQQLDDFAAGHRVNAPPEILEFAAGLSHQERAAIADYVSRMTPSAAASPFRPQAASAKKKNP
jgi:cytochrome c553